MFVHRHRVPLAAVLVVAAAVPAAGCSGPPPPATLSPATEGSGIGGGGEGSAGGGGSAELDADDRWWWAIESLTRTCMADAGFPDYAVMPAWSPDAGPRSGHEWLESVPAARRDVAREALFGTAATSTAPTWQDTGCHGRAIHDAGAD